MASEWVLVRGTAYKLVRSFLGGRERVFWLRLSVPPDATPGKRSKWPVRYPEHKLPAHEVIGEERAKEIQKDSVARLHEVYRQHAETQEGTSGD